jgi:hypothetical protein
LRLLERRHRRVEFVSLTRAIDRAFRSRRRSERVVGSSGFTSTRVVLRAASSGAAATETVSTFTIMMMIVVAAVVVVSAFTFHRIVARALGEIVFGAGFDSRAGFRVEGHVRLTFDATHTDVNEKASLLLERQEMLQPRGRWMITKRVVVYRILVSNVVVATEHGLGE